MDERIITLLQKRDESALRLIKELYGGKCRQLAYRILGSQEDAEECLSDMLMKVWESIPPAQPQVLESYLVTLVRRCALDRLRREHAQKRGGTQFSASLDELAEILPSGEGLEQELDRRALLAAIQGFLQAQPQRTRVIFMQRYFLAAPVADIAAAVHISENAVKKQLMRTREKLREHLRKEGFL